MVIHFSFDGYLDYKQLGAIYGNFSVFNWRR